MQTTQKKNILLMWLIATLIISVSLINEANSNPDATITAPTVLDTSLTPGSTFSIDITVAEVDRLFGFNFRLSYNTTVLTAVGNASYAPFTAKAPCIINDTEGYIYLAYTYPPPEKVGFTSLVPAPIARIDFKVDSLGTSPLNLSEVTLPDVTAYLIPFVVSNGFFANVAVELHDIAVTNVIFSPAKVELNETVTITVTIENKGDFQETFSVSVYLNTTLLQNQTGITLEAGTNIQRTFTWKANKAGAYTVRAVASTVTGEIDTANNTLAAAERLKVTSSGGGGLLGLPPWIWYVGAGVGIVVVIAIIALALRRRKPEPEE